MFCRSISHNPRSCFALFVIAIDVRTQKFSWVVLLVLVRWLGLLGNVKYHNGVNVMVVMMMMIVMTLVLMLVLVLVILLMTAFMPMLPVTYLNPHILILQKL